MSPPLVIGAAGIAQEQNVPSAQSTRAAAFWDMGIFVCRFPVFALNVEYTSVYTSDDAGSNRRRIPGGHSMSRRATHTDARVLETQADLLLSQTCPDDRRPRTEAQLRRKAIREVRFGLEPPPARAGNDAVEDLLFIGRHAPLSEPMRQAYVLWVEGYTVREIASLLGMSRQSAGRALRSALVRCWAMGPVTLSQMSRRATYAAPALGPRPCRGGARCEVCAAPLWDDYERRTCNDPWCEAVDRQRRALDRRRMTRW